MDATPDPVRVVLFGNSFASRVQLPALAWAQGNHVVGIAGRDGAKAHATAEAWGIEHATDDWRGLLELEPDLVIVTTPVDLHRPMVLAAAETGAAVLCEKPFAMNEVEAREMCAALEGRGAWIDHQLRWSPALRELRRKVREGELGEVRCASFEMILSPGPGYFERPFRWWYDAERGGGVLGALGSHLVDLVRFVCGEVVDTRARLATLKPRREDPDGGAPREVTADEVAWMWLTLEGGAAVEVRTAVGVPSERGFRIQVEGTAGVARLDDGADLYAAPVGAELEPAAVPAEFPTHEQTGMPPAGVFARCLPLYLRDLVAAVGRGEHELPLAATFEDGLATQRVLDAARASAQKV